MKNFIAVSICAFALVACGSEESSKNTRDAAQNSAPEQAAPAKNAQVAPSGTMTDAQVFAYILGRDYGLPTYLNTPDRIGEMLDLDAMVQGVIDNESVLADTNRMLQVSPEVQRQVEAHYMKLTEERRAAGANAKPVVLAGPITGGKVVISDTTSLNIKYSYMQGVQIHSLFDAVQRNFGEKLDVKFFIRGLRESVYGAMDPSFIKSVSEDTLKAVNARYVARMEKIREERRNALQ